jgi:transglutaminase-like putative cysteine protease
MKRVLAIVAILLFTTATAFALHSSGKFHWGYTPSDEENYSYNYVPDPKPDAFIADLTAEFRVTKNPARENVLLYLPLPANRRLYQRVLSYKLDPDPTRIIQSRHGYQIAEFNFGPLSPGEPFMVHYHGEVELYDVSIPITSEMVGDLSEIPEKIRKDYLVNGPYYRLKDPYIQAAAKEAVGEETNPYLMVRKIWLYVRERLYYNGDGRKDTAARVLKQGHGTCTEYSFSMIALSRANGIPARYMSGSLTKARGARVTSRDTIFHKIVEVYLPRVGWVPMESTSGGRYVNEKTCDQQIANLRPRMLFYQVETERGLAPLDPRRNTFTYVNVRMRSNVKLTGQVVHLWERVKNRAE